MLGEVLPNFDNTAQQDFAEGLELLIDILTNNLSVSYILASWLPRPFAKISWYPLHWRML